MFNSFEFLNLEHLQEEPNICKNVHLEQVDNVRGWFQINNELGKRWMEGNHGEAGAGDVVVGAEHTVHQIETFYLMVKGHLSTQIYI